MNYKFKHDNLSQLVYVYKYLKGFELNDTTWDKIAWARTSKAAKDLLLLFKDNLDSATDFLESFSKVEYAWTIETVIRAKTDNFNAK